jgi:cupin fold WbuC family metalloprotein
MKLIDQTLLAELSAMACAAPRGRKNYNLHAELTDPVQRFLNAMEPDTYVRPHWHADADKWELFIVLSGAISVLIFTDDGVVSERLELGVDGTRCIEIPPQTPHTLLSRAHGTVVFECKRGPYTAMTDKEFARWAPAENTPGVAAFMEWLVNAQPGSRPPAI